jgi:predicted RNA-binding protein (virulence factor B family)
LALAIVHFNGQKSGRSVTLGMAPKDPIRHELWLTAKTQYPVGNRLTGTVVHQAPFGVFLDVGMGHVRALLELGGFADAPDYVPGAPMPAERIMLRYPELGEVVTATVLGYREGNHQIDISAKPVPVPH